MMQAFGVWSAVLLGTLLLALGVVLIERPDPARGSLLLVIVGVAMATNLHDRQRADTAYADSDQVVAGRVFPRKC